jgi:hypothetical protein
VQDSSREQRLLLILVAETCFILKMCKGVSRMFVWPGQMKVEDLGSMWIVSQCEQSSVWGSALNTAPVCPRLECLMGRPLRRRGHCTGQIIFERCPF